MRDRVAHLRQHSVDTRPFISAERARLLTEFYAANDGKYSVPVMRALAFKYLCEHKTIYIGEGELIVGERGPEPLATPTFPELTCHSLEDLEVLDSREKTSYGVSPEVIEIYSETVIPYWRGRSIRERAFQLLPPEWHDAYGAGIFTEFMEQRAPGHTVADGKIYEKGLLDFKDEIATAIVALDFINDPEAYDKREQLMAMDIAADAMIFFAQRHAEMARQLAEVELDEGRKSELHRIASTCERVPAHAPTNFWEALQAYWFYHLGVITELNGWDSFNPGHLDQHLEPFLRAGPRRRQSRPRRCQGAPRVLLGQVQQPPCSTKSRGDRRRERDLHRLCQHQSWWAEKGWHRWCQRGLLPAAGGHRRDAHPAAEQQHPAVAKDPRSVSQSCGKSDPQRLRFPLGIQRRQRRRGALRQGKTVEDAREGGTSGCVETGAFGKEAYILTGYFNLVKILEVTLNNGWDPRTGKQLGPETGEPGKFKSIEELFEAWRTQVDHFIGIKLRGNHVFERLYATSAPAPLLSLITDDCIQKGKDYNAGGARYNTSYIQGVGTGTLTDSLAAIQHLVFDQQTVSMKELLEALDGDFENQEKLRQLLVNKPPKYGNDDDAADDWMVSCFEAFYEAVEGRPNARGGEYHINMLPTTCHIYFGSVTGATPDGRHRGEPMSEGISPVQGSDRHGPTAVFKSAAKMDQIKTGGTLLNMKFTPQLLAGDDGIDNLASLIRGYFKMDSHHVQFNVVTADALREAQARPDEHRHLIVRVAGYSDYFCDLSQALQDEIIARTEHEVF